MNKKIETGLGRICDCCHSAFISRFSIPAVHDRVLVGQFENCPYCNCLVKSPDGKFVSFNGKIRFLPLGATATRVPNPDLSRPRTKQVNFSVGSGSNLHSTWKMQKNGNDIYILNRELGGVWKISIHKSGLDYVGFTSEFVAGKFMSTHSGRHFFRMPRSVTYLAHYTRILRINMVTRPGWSHPFKFKPFDARGNSKLKVINPTSESQTISIDLIFSNDHPEEFKELYVDQKNIVAFMHGGQDEYFQLVVSADWKSISSESVQDRITFFYPENNHADAREMTITLGKTRGQTILIEVIHD